MKARPTRNFSPKFRLETAQLVVDQNYGTRYAAEAMNVGNSTMDKQVRQLNHERNGQSTQATTMTPVQLKKNYPESCHRSSRLMKKLGVYQLPDYWAQIQENR